MTVQAPSQALAERVCGVAERAIRKLESCHLPQLAPIDLVVRDLIDDAEVACLGRYQFHNHRVEILSPDRFAAVISEDHPFAALPGDEIFESVIVHELAHALAHQRNETLLGCPAELEYIAYSVQLDWLSPRSREHLLSSVESKHVPIERLNAMMARAVPMKFAAWSWLHFSRPENGCAFINDLLNGNRTLGLPDL